MQDDAKKLLDESLVLMDAMFRAMWEAHHYDYDGTSVGACPLCDVPFWHDHKPDCRYVAYRNAVAELTGHVAPEASHAEFIESLERKDAEKRAVYINENPIFHSILQHHQRYGSLFHKVAREAMRKPGKPVTFRRYDKIE